MACSAEVEDAKRLACYDAAVAAGSAEARAIAARRDAAREAAAAEKAAAEARAKAEAAEAARKAQADRFGQEGLRLGGGDPDRLDELGAKIAETLLDRVGKTVFLLDNGQMWRQTDGLTLPPIRAGDAVEIRRGAVGGYRLTVPRVKRTVPVVRMR